MQLGTSVIFFLLSYFGQKLYIRLALSQKLMDVPNDRSLHVIPKPRGGGIVVCILAIFAMAMVFYPAQSQLFYVLSLSSALVALIGFKDDISGASIRMRLAVHFAAALVISYFHATLMYTGVEFFIFTLVGVGLIVFCINIYNFMDGIDGMCAGYSLAILIWLTVLVYIKQNLLLAQFGLLLAAILLGFLLLNWAPSKVFMGDAGSGFLGLMLPAFFILSFGLSAQSLILFCTLNAAFFADSVWTLVVRATKGEKFYQAHRQHAYQHASLRLKSHAMVSGLYIGYTLLYTGPLALLGVTKPQLLPLVFVAAYLPLTVWLIKNRAGLKAV